MDIAAVEERTLARAREIARLCDDKRGEDICALDLRGVCDFADVFVIVTAGSRPQMKGLTREIEAYMHKEHVSQISRHGVQEGIWVVLDYGDTVIHIFDEERRQFYQMEELWGDGKKINWE